MSCDVGEVTSLSVAWRPAHEFYVLVNCRYTQIFFLGIESNIIKGFGYFPDDRNFTGDYLWRHSLPMHQHGMLCKRQKHVSYLKNADMLEKENPVQIRQQTIKYTIYFVQVNIYRATCTYSPPSCSIFNATN